MISRRMMFGAALALATPAHAEEPPAPPSSLADLGDTRLQRRDGVETTLGEELALDRPSVITFWATWCTPCQPEARYLEEIRRQYPQLQILGVNIDSYRSEINFNWFLQRTGAAYPQVYGDFDAYRALAGNGPMSLPRSFVYAAGGRGVADLRGFRRGESNRAIRRAVAATS